MKKLAIALMVLSLIPTVSVLADDFDDYKKQEIVAISDVSSTTIENIKDIVLKKAKLSKDDVNFIKIDIDDDDDEVEVEFISNGKKYEYELVNNKVVKTKVKTVKKSTVKNLAIEQAKKIAIGDKSEKDVKFTKVEFDNDDFEVEIKYIYDGNQYEVEIDLDSQEIIKEKVKKYKVSDKNLGKISSLDDAKKAIHTLLNIKDSDVLSYDAEAKKGKFEYEFSTKDMKYDYEISTSGKILKSKSKKIKFKYTNVKISREDAESIVLKEINDNKAFIKEIDLSREDGEIVYEVKACVGNVEYEYEISAQTGEVLSFDIDD